MKQMFLLIVLLHSVSVLSSPLRGRHISCGDVSENVCRSGALNPSNGAIYFTAKHLPTQNYTIEVFDVTGKVVFTKAYSNDDDVKRINLELNNGIYLLQITDSDNGKTYKHKFVVQH